MSRDASSAGSRAWMGVESGVGSRAHGNYHVPPGHVYGSGD